MSFRVYPPRLRAEAHHRRVLEQLSQLIGEHLSRTTPNATDSEFLLLSSEAQDLGVSIAELLEDRDFFGAVDFVDGLCSDHLNEERLKAAYLAGRKRAGYSRAVATSQWHQYLTRLGSKRTSQSTLVISAKRMEFEQFLFMERRLFDELKIIPRSRNFLMESIKANQSIVEEARDLAANFRGQSPIKRIMRNTREVLDQLRSGVDKLSVSQVTGLTILVANSTVLFASRDWGVAGTISTMAGGVGMQKKG